MDNEFGKAFTARQFVELERFQVLVKLLEDGTVREPFRAATLPPLGKSTGRRKHTIARSRERYAAARSLVESKLLRYAQNNTTSAAPRGLSKPRINARARGKNVATRYNRNR